MEYIYFFFTVIILFCLVLLVASFWEDNGGFFASQDPAKIAGRDGEKFATAIIKRALHDDDVLITNVKISYRDAPAELDNVIINQYGVFIIEVKYYTGTLVGSENEYKWTKQHVSRGDNLYIKTVKNPIPQVKRQVYLLAKYLEDYGLRTWVEGYVLFTENNSPVNSDYVLRSISDIEVAVHRTSHKILTKQKKAAIIDLLKPKD